MNSACLAAPGRAAGPAGDSEAITISSKYIVAAEELGFATYSPSEHHLHRFWAGLRVAQSCLES